MANATEKSKNSTRPLIPLEQRLPDQFSTTVKVAVNKNEAGYFRLPFQAYQHMLKILANLDYNTDEKIDF